MTPNGATMSQDTRNEHTQNRKAQKFGERVDEQSGFGRRPVDDRVGHVLGLLLLIVGVGGAVLAYRSTLAMDDMRDIASAQVLALVFVAITVLGGVLYTTAKVTTALRWWLLRQVMESRQRDEQLAEVLGRGADGQSSR